MNLVHNESYLMMDFMLLSLITMMMMKKKNENEKNVISFSFWMNDKIKTTNMILMVILLLY